MFEMRTLLVVSLGSRPRKMGPHTGISVEPWAGVIRMPSPVKNDSMSIPFQAAQCVASVCQVCTYEPIVAQCRIPGGCARDTRISAINLLGTVRSLFARSNRGPLVSPLRYSRSRDFVLNAYQYRRSYALAGIAISIGAPLGMLLVQVFVLRLYSLGAIWGEISSNGVIYLYVSLTTTLAFAVFGFVLGRQLDALQCLSTTDALTGLYNRGALTTYLEHEYHRARRYRSSLSVLLVDVDQLKRVNDVYGHAAGDRVIRGFANAIKTTLRDTDVGGRWGGDEFLIIAPGTAGAAAATLADRLRFELARQEATTEGKATGSVGVAVLDPNRHPPEGPEVLLQAADAALYRAKAAGRNQVRVL
jgi:diguanylate cyclase (GGDEF)-like protein